MHVCPAKSSGFESTDFASVMIDDVGCSRRHQCARCAQWAISFTQTMLHKKDLSHVQVPQTAVNLCFTTHSFLGRVTFTLLIWSSGTAERARNGRIDSGSLRITVGNCS